MVRDAAPRQRLVLRRPVSLPELTTVREAQAARVPRWREQLRRADLPADTADALRACVRAFDLDNWEVVDLPDEPKAWRQRATTGEEEEREKAVAEAKEALLLLNFPHRCRELLDRRELMSVAELEQFWADLRRVGAMLDGPGNDALPFTADAPPGVDDLLEAELPAVRRRNVLAGVMGGVAVLLLRHPAWLDEDRGRKAWAMRQLRRVPRLPQPGGAVDRWHPDETDDRRWECFFAELVALFWSRRPRSRPWRHMAAAITLGFHHTPIARLFAAAYGRRAELAGGFEELVHLLLRCAVVRWHWERARQGLPVPVDMPAEAERAYSDFMSGRLAGEMPSCREMAALPQPRPPDNIPPSLRQGLDLPVIAAGLGCIVRPEDARDGQERRRWIGLWRDLLDWRLNPLDSGPATPDPDEKSPGYGDRWPHNPLPYRSDRWLLRRVAEVVLQLRPEERPERLWQPVLDLAGHMHHWTEEFLTSFFWAAFGRPCHSGRLRGDVAGDGQLRRLFPPLGHGRRRGVAHLFGFDHLVHSSWRQEHAPLLESVREPLSGHMRMRMTLGLETEGVARLPATAGGERNPARPSGKSGARRRTGRTFSRARVSRPRRPRSSTPSSNRTAKKSPAAPTCSRRWAGSSAPRHSAGAARVRTPRAAASPLKEG